MFAKQMVKASIREVGEGELINLDNNLRVKKFIEGGACPATFSRYH